MPDQTSPPAVPVPSRERSAAYVTLHLDASGDAPFLLGRRSGRAGGAVGLSIASHVGVLALFLWLTRIVPGTPRAIDLFPDRERPELIWLAQEGPGGGGGGGGNEQPEPPRQLQTPGHDQLAVPVLRPPDLSPKTLEVKNEAPPIEQLDIPAVSMNLGAVMLPGALQGNPDPTATSLGPGSGGGAGSGRGTGIGPGTGPGLGPGSGGGTGGGAYRPGSGVTEPIPLFKATPKYTGDALRAKIQGTVWVECVVLPDGTVSRPTVTKSLDAVFGLDDEAVKAVRQWRFAPGRRQGVPVPVLVVIEVGFNLR